MTIHALNPEKPELRSGSSEVLRVCVFSLTEASPGVGAELLAGWSLAVDGINHAASGSWAVDPRISHEADNREGEREK